MRHFTPRRSSGLLLLAAFGLNLGGVVMYSAGTAYGWVVETPTYHAWERGLFMAAFVVAALGVAVLKLALGIAGAAVWPRLAAATFLMGSTVALVAEAASLSGQRETAALMVVMVLMLLGAAASWAGRCSSAGSARSGSGGRPWPGTLAGRWSCASFRRAICTTPSCTPSRSSPSASHWPSRPRPRRRSPSGDGPAAAGPLSSTPLRPSRSGFQQAASFVRRPVSPPTAGRLGVSANSMALHATRHGQERCEARCWTIPNHHASASNHSANQAEVAYNAAS